MMRRPLFWLVCSFCTGVIVSRYLTGSPALWLFIIGGFILIGLLLYMFGRLNIDRLGRILLIGAFLTGAFWYALSQYPAHMYNNLNGLTLTGKGMVVTYPHEGEYSYSFIIRVNELKVENKEMSCLEKLQFKVKGGISSNIQAGTVIGFQGVAEIPDGPRNPGGFNYRTYLANQGIFYQISCPADSLKIIEESSGLRGAAARVRQSVRIFVEESLPERESGLLLGFLFGDTTGITDEEWELYQKAGVLHLFAISGLHVALMLGVAYFLLSFLSDSALVRALCGMVVLIFYYFLIGWKVSFVRAAIMVFLGMIALLTGRRSDLYTSAAVAVIVILLINPGELFQMGFQMSFAAAVGIVYYSAYFARHGLGKYLPAALAAQLTTMPLIAYNFNLISLVAPFLNILALAVSPFIAGLGLAGALLICVMPMLAKPFMLSAGFLLYLLSELILQVASCGWAAWTVPTPPPWLVLLSYAVLLLIPQTKRWRPYLRYLFRHYRVFMISGLVLVLIISFWPHPAQMKVVFLDVGQGDSIFIRTPCGHTLLVDGGGTPASDYAIGKKVVRPFLLKEGLAEIDIMVMSHNDLDHSEGLLELLPYLHVGCFMMPPPEGENEIEEEILKCCQASGIPVKELVAGEKVLLEKDAYVEVLHPEDGNSDKGNNHSLVLRLVYKEAEWLLTGDIENKAIEEILDQKSLLSSDVLKLPHHGSISSYCPEFYEEVDPRVVVVSVGYNNFNQPHPEIREYFYERKIPFYSTKDKGAVVTQSDGERIWIETVKY